MTVPHPARVPLSPAEQQHADHVAARCAQYFKGDRFSHPGNLASETKRPERYRASRRAEKAVALMLGLPWNCEPAQIAAGLADVGDDVEVRAVSKHGWRLKYDPARDKPERRYVLVWPVGEDDVPTEFDLMGWAFGHELRAATPNLVLDDGALLFNAERLRPIQELYSLV